LLAQSLVSMPQDKDLQSEKIEMHGYLKDLQSLSFADKIDSVSAFNLLHNRLNFKFNLSDKISGRLEIRNRIFWGDQLRQIPDFGKVINRYNGLVSLSRLWVNNSSLVIHSVVDRLLVHYQPEKWDITIGRQRINWGINTIWNPNDIFNAYNFLDFDYEERPGNDAIRVKRYLKNNATVDLAWKPSKNRNEHTAALLYKFNRKRYDYQLLAGIYRQDLVIGGGWAGNIKKAGFKGEVSYFHPRNKFSDSSGVISFSLMADQTFKGDWYLALAFLFNSDPPGTSGPVETIFGQELSAKSLFPYRYTFYTGFMKTFTPITSLNFSLIYSPDKNSLICFPSLAWNAAENLDLNLIMQSFFSKEENRYKSQGTAMFIRIRWSF